MILNKTDIKRLIIYFFYDKDGIVDRYVPYMLRDMRKNCSELFVVVNGKLTAEGRKIFEDVGAEVMVRENVGFDVWAYKEAMEHYGWEKLGEFDEVVLMNHTIMGPIYPFSEMFNVMDKKDLDFWGMTVYHKQEANPFGIKYGYLPTHLQSHFICVRKSMLRGIDFQNYWSKIPEINSYADAVGKHEAIFTKTFEDKGYKWEAYIDTEDIKDFTGYPLMWCADRLIKEKRCPVFKRRSFFHNYYDALSNNNGQTARKLMEYLQTETEYDIRMVWENILRTDNLADIKNSMNLSYVLPRDVRNGGTINRKFKIALIMHIYYEDQISYCYRYALSMPAQSDVIITTHSKKNKELIEKEFKEGKWNKVYVELIENRGRDVSALLIGAADYVDNYDFVCFVHDKKVTQISDGIQGYYFSDRCFENLLSTEEYVANIINRFEKEPYLGMMFPPPPNHGDYYPTMGCEWRENFDCTKELMKKLEITVPISSDKEPIAPLGTMFWVRPKALKPLFNKKWKYEDFPKEPNKNDGTILHAFERVYPFAVQQSGYYVAWCLNDKYAENEITNLSYWIRNINSRLFYLYGVGPYFTTIARMDANISNVRCGAYMSISKRGKIKFFLKRIIPRPFWNGMRKIYTGLGGKKWIG